MELTAIVAGGTGEVGSGVVKRLLQEGARVIVPFRTHKKKYQFMASLSSEDCSNLECIEVQIDSYESASNYMQMVEDKYGNIDLAVASLGGWEGGYKLYELDYKEWQRIMDNNLNTHFIFAKLCLDLFYRQNKGVYINLNGSTSEKIKPGAGLMSIIGAAENRMTQVMNAENENSNVRIYSLELFTPVLTRNHLEDPKKGCVTSEQVGDYLLGLYNRTGENLDKPIHVVSSVEDL